jgi:hypothetical protein
MKKTIYLIIVSTLALFLISWSGVEISKENINITDELSVYVKLTEKCQIDDTSFYVTASNCNFFYRGLDNPIEVNVPGYSKEEIFLSINNCATIRKVDNGSYIVTVPKTVTANDISITVAVKNSEGGKRLGSTKFTVLNVPPAKAKLCGLYADCSVVSKSEIKNSPYLSAELVSGFFPFEGLEYTISSYSFIYSCKGVARTIKVSASGGNLTDEVLDEIERMSLGSIVCFSNIEVIGPSGIEDVGSCMIILR